MATGATGAFAAAPVEDAALKLADLIRGATALTIYEPGGIYGALIAHASQVLEADTFMGISAGAFHRLLGTEWYRKARIAA